MYRYREYYKETRFLGAFGYFKNLYISSLRLLNRKTWTAEKKSGLIEIGMKCITLLGYMGVLYLLVNSLVKGDISVGAFGAVFASLIRMFNTMEEIITEYPFINEIIEKEAMKLKRCNIDYERLKKYKNSSLGCEDLKSGRVCFDN